MFIHMYMSKAPCSGLSDRLVGSCSSSENNAEGMRSHIPNPTFVVFRSDGSGTTYIWS